MPTAIVKKDLLDSGAHTPINLDLLLSILNGTSNFYISTLTVGIEAPEGILPKGTGYLDKSTGIFYVSDGTQNVNPTPSGIFEEWSPVGNAIINLPDDAGASSLQVQDSNGNIVAKIDSLGTVTAVVDEIITGNFTASGLITSEAGLVTDATSPIGWQMKRDGTKYGDWNTGNNHVSLGLSNGASFDIIGGNVGIGTTLPTSPVGVAKFLEISGTTAGIVLKDTDVYAWEMYASTGQLVTLYNGTIAGWRLDPYGNMGLGVVPQATNSSNSAFYIGGVGSLISTTSQAAGSYIFLNNNTFHDGAGWKYISTDSDEATRYYQADGKHVWDVAVAGTAGNPVNGTGLWTNALTIENSANSTFGGKVTVSGGWIVMDPLQRFYLDGGNNTYIREQSADVIGLTAGGVTQLTLDNTTATATVSGNLKVNGTLGMGVTPSVTVLFTVESSIADWAARLKNTHVSNGYGLLVEAGDDDNVLAFKVNDRASNSLFSVKGGGTVIVANDFTAGTVLSSGGFAMGGVSLQAQQSHIVDADGTLPDITSKFNTLLADLEGFGFLAAA